MATIFISYNRDSEEVVKALAQDIEALGHTVWIDKALNGGQAWWDHILENVRSCDLLICVLDASFLNSMACKLEYGYATTLGKTILPVLVGDGVSMSLLPPALSQIQYVDYRKQDRDAVLRLAGAIASVPPPAPLPDPLPTPPEIPISYLGRLAEQIEAESPLTYEQQSALVVDLKRSLRDQEISNDAYELLGRLRKRRDLLAAIAEEIDELLGGEASKQPQEDVRRQGQGGLSEAPAQWETQPPGTTQSERPSLEQYLPEAGGAPTARERRIAALAGGPLGIGVGLALLASGGARGDEWLLALIPAAGGAIAGAITGAQKHRLVGACLGGALGWAVAAIFISLSGGPHPIEVGGVFGAPPGAIVGAVAAVVVRARQALR